MYNFMKSNPKRNKSCKAHLYADGNSFAASAVNREKNKTVFVAADKSKVN